MPVVFAAQLHADLWISDASAVVVSLNSSPYGSLIGPGSAVRVNRMDLCCADC